MLEARREMRDELITITRMMLSLPPAVQGELPSPSDDPPALAAPGLSAEPKTAAPRSPAA